MPIIKKLLLTAILLPGILLAKDGYNRKAWPHWIDADHDCQNTRTEILIQYSQGPLKFKRHKNCNVSFGKWLDPYSGKVFSKASELDIDHIVPLKHAFQNGALKWDRKMRSQFANDPLNLVPVSKKLNRQKGSKGPARWKPPFRKSWCEYAIRWKEVKKKYKLNSSKREIASLQKMTDTCQ